MPQQAVPIEVSLSCAVLCQFVSLQYLSRSSLHRLAGLPCPSVVFEAVDVPSPGPFHFVSHCAMTFVLSLLPRRNALPRSVAPLGNAISGSNVGASEANTAPQTA